MTDRFKGLDLIDRVPKNYGYKFVTLYRSDQEHPQEKEMQKDKLLSEEVLQIDEKRRDAKGKGGKERYTHLNVQFQRTARRDKKAFLSDQCKEIKEDNRIGKTRDLKKIRDTKGTFHAKMGTIKDRNGISFIQLLKNSRNKGGHRINECTVKVK